MNAYAKSKVDARLGQQIFVKGSKPSNYNSRWNDAETVRIQGNDRYLRRMYDELLERAMKENPRRYGAWF